MGGGRGDESLCWRAGVADFLTVDDLEDGLGVDVGGRGYLQEVAGGREGVVDVDSQLGVACQVEVFLDARAAENPDDMGAAVVGIPMGIAGAAMVGDGKDGRLVDEVGMAKLGEEEAEGGVGVMSGEELIVGPPAAAVACGVNAGKLYEEEVGAMELDHFGGLLGDLEVLGIDLWDVGPIEGVGGEEGLEFGFAGGDGGGVAGFFGEFEERWDFWMDDRLVGAVEVGPDGVLGGQAAGQHAGVSGEGERRVNGQGGVGEASGVGQCPQVGHVGAEGDVGA